MPRGDEDPQRSHGQYRNDDVQSRTHTQGLRPHGKSGRQDRRPGEADNDGRELQPVHHPLHLEGRSEPLLPLRASLQRRDPHAGDHVVEAPHHHLKDEADGHPEQAESRHRARIPPQGQDPVKHEQAAEEYQNRHGVGKLLVARHRQREVVEAVAGHRVHRAAARRERIAHSYCRGPDQQGPPAEPRLRQTHGTPRMRAWCAGSSRC